MRNTILTTVALLGLFLSASCAGIHARTEVQIPAMQLAYGEVIQKHVERGLAEPGVPATAAAEVAAFEAALESGDRAALFAQLTAWRETVRVLFSLGLDARVRAGELGPNGAAVLLETAVQFDANMTLLGAR